MQSLIPFIAYTYATVAFLGLYAINLPAIIIGAVGLSAAFYLESHK